MTPDQEIERIKQEYKDHWHKLENHPGIRRALENKDVVKLGEIAAMVAYGNYYDAGVAHQASHPFFIYFNYEQKGFRDVESAKQFIARQKSLNPTSLMDDCIYRRFDDGRVEIHNAYAKEQKPDSPKT